MLILYQAMAKFFSFSVSFSGILTAIFFFSGCFDLAAILFPPNSYHIALNAGSSYN